MEINRVLTSKPQGNISFKGPRGPGQRGMISFKGFWSPGMHHENNVIPTQPKDNTFGRKLNYLA